MSELSIGEVSRRAGVRPSALRYYERIGLLSAPKRLNGRRRYDPRVLHELTYIQFAQRVGFTLSEIKHLNSHGQGTASSLAGWQKAVDAKLEQLHAQIEDRLLMTKMLRRSQACHCRGPEDCVIQDRAWWSGAGLPDL